MKRFGDIFPEAPPTLGNLPLITTLRSPATRSLARKYIILACVERQILTLRELFPDNNPNLWEDICNRGEVPDWLSKL